jgi:hypothetical protein
MNNLKLNIIKFLMNFYSIYARIIFTLEIMMKCSCISNKSNIYNRIQGFQ